MSAGDRAQGTSYSFALTPEQAKAIAARAGLRAALMGRLSRSHVGPLVVFVLFLVFVAIFILTGLMSRRLGEAALLVAAIVFMASRMAAHWRLRGAKKSSLVAAMALQEAGEITIWIDEAGVRLETASKSRHLAYADCEEAEDAGEIIYLWPRRGEPVFIPAQTFETTEAAQKLLALARAGSKLPRAVAGG